MIAWLIKSILCSGLLWLVYVLFLEREKMHRFNRFYLLFSIAFSFLVPLVTIRTDAPALSLPENIGTIVYETTSIPISQPVRTPAVAANNNTPVLPLLICLLYGVITAWLLYRFLRNIVSLSRQIRRYPSVPYGNARLILAKAGIIPHSFLHYVFLDREAFEKGKVEKEILFHELTHVRQRHTLDILLLEALRIVLWFNPFLYLYRKSIQLNHEFLADASVVSTFEDTPAYQYLLLGKAGTAPALSLSHAFNYSITKKRLIMMTRKSHRLISFFKQVILVPALAATAVLLFSERIIAQTQTPARNPAPTVNKPAQKDTTKPHVWLGKPVGFTKEGASEQLLDEYERIIDKYKVAGKRPLSGFREKITQDDWNRLEAIFKEMSQEQQQQQRVAFVTSPGPLPKVTPTQKQLEAFKNAQVYGVWLDGKKVSNTLLNNYTNTDFSQVFISKLYGAAKKNVSYSHQVDLMTNQYYQDYYNKTIAQKESILVLTWQGPPEAKTEEVR